MRVVFPVPYLDRLEPGSSGLCIRFDDVAEHEVPEIAGEDAPVIVSARSSFRNDHEDLCWRSIDLRLHDGKLLRSAKNSADSGNCIVAQAIPRRIGHRIDWGDSEFVRLLPGWRDKYLTSAVLDLRNGKSGFSRIRTALDPGLLEEWSRERMRKMTELALARLVLIDGQLWKQTNWPRIRLGGDRSLMAQITFDEEKEWVRPWYGHLPFEARMILLSQNYMVSEIAEEAGIPLSDGHQVIVDHIDFDALPYLNERVAEAWRVASTLEHRASSIIGEQPATAVASWLALRDALRKRDPDAGVEDILQLVLPLKEALGWGRPDIAAETDKMLSVLNIDEAISPARSESPRR
jgi:hypothetical protein